MPIIPYWVLDLPVEAQGVALQRIRAREVRRLRNLCRYRRMSARRRPVQAATPRPLPLRLTLPRGAFSLKAIAAYAWTRVERGTGPRKDRSKAKAARAARREQRA